LCKAIRFAIYFVQSEVFEIFYEMNLHLLFILVTAAPVLAIAKDPCPWTDPYADEPDSPILKPYSPEIPEVGLKPQCSETGTEAKKPWLSSAGENREARPEKCVITTYTVPEPGGPSHALENIQTMIEYDPATGEGKVSAATMFGKNANGQVGIVKKEPYSGNLIIYTAESPDSVTYTKPTQVIEDLAKPDSSASSKRCEDDDALNFSNFDNIKVYPVNEFGNRPLFSEPVANADVKCSK